MDTPSLASDAGNARSRSHSLAAVYRWMQHHIQVRMGSPEILLLTTFGNDSQKPQTVALGYFRDGPDLVVVGSNYGGDQHPMWYRNLQQHPRVGVQIEETVWQMIASTATPAERAQLFGRLGTEDRQYGRYQRHTAREIPIVLLHSELPVLRTPSPQLRTASRVLIKKKPMPHRGIHLEGRDLIVPLAISVRHWRTPDYVGAAAPRAQRIIATYLQDAAREGWQADEPTDFATLFSRSRVRTRNTFLRWRVDSATIRVLRAVEDV